MCIWMSCLVWLSVLWFSAVLWCNFLQCSSYSAVLTVQCSSLVQFLTVQFLQCSSYSAVLTVQCSCLVRFLLRSFTKCSVCRHSHLVLVISHFACSYCWMWCLVASYAHPGFNHSCDCLLFTWTCAFLWYALYLYSADDVIVHALSDAFVFTSCWVFMCVYVMLRHLYVHINDIFIYAQPDVFVCVCVCVCVCVLLCVCAYVCVCIYIYTHTLLYIYIYTHTHEKRLQMCVCTYKHWIPKNVYMWWKTSNLRMCLCMNACMLWWNKYGSL